MTPSEFAAKWSGVTTSERASAQAHFIDLCRMLGVPAPHDADPTGEWYAFEKGASKSGGGDGFADVWKRSHFAWEYKGKKKDLAAAYQQLLQYREALENPPLLVVSDLDRFEVHTNFTNTAAAVHGFTLAELATAPKEPLRVLRAVMTDPESLRPTTTRDQLTEEAARLFATIAQLLQARGGEPRRVAHFLNKLLFCLFAEDSGLLPKGLMGRLVEATKTDPPSFVDALRDLFGKMSARGGYFGAEKIEWFNGGLFDGDDVIHLEQLEMTVVQAVSRLDWSQIEPAIFGTLFERGLDPNQRGQLGAHYTDRGAIERLVLPVVITPLRREYEAMQAEVTQLVLGGRKTAQKQALARFATFLDRVRSVRVLDPACGSGNFLYIALQALKDLEREAILWGSLVLKVPQEFPRVGPHQLIGIEINAYAAELARVTIWIGEIQWMLNNGFAYLRDPILRPLDNIREQDALVDWSDPEHPKEAEWPDAEFIVGNPPFLGNRLLRRALGSPYVEPLFRIFGDRLPASSDFVCYWHEKARAMVEAGRAERVGLLATQGIRGQANRTVIERIKGSGDLFLAWSDEPWILAGASVHVSFLGYDNGSDRERYLNGRRVEEINANLTAGSDLTKASRLRQNQDVAFYADVKAGAFELDEWAALQMLDDPNPDGRDNRDVVRPWINALDVTRRPRGMWVVDFGISMSREEAALYEAPFRYVATHVRFARARTRRASYRDRWWLHAEPGRGMRRAIEGLQRFIATPAVSKHRLFVWVPSDFLPDHAVVVVARDDDCTFGVLHSRVHELWALHLGTQLETRPRYTPTTTFETFPFPHPTPEQAERIATAAHELDELRRGWLYPPNWTEEQLESRTLTKLYNERPQWLIDVHRRLDDAVLDAYGWPTELPDDEILARLLDINLARASAYPKRVFGGRRPSSPHTNSR